MRLDYELPKTGHPNCRRPDKVIDAGHTAINAEVPIVIYMQRLH